MSFFAPSFFFSFILGLFKVSLNRVWLLKVASCRRSNIRCQLWILLFAKLNGCERLMIQAGVGVDEDTVPSLRPIPCGHESIELEFVRGLYIIRNLNLSNWRVQNSFFLCREYFRHNPHLWIFSNWFCEFRFDIYYIILFYFLDISKEKRI